MDPTAALKAIHQAKRWQDCYDNIVALYNWLCSGGFQPAWNKYEKGSARYHALVEELLCDYGYVPDSLAELDNLPLTPGESDDDD